MADSRSVRGVAHMSRDGRICECGHGMDKHLYPALARSAEGKRLSVPGPCSGVDELRWKPCGCSRFSERR